MRRKSAINQEKRRLLVEQARGMTPEERLAVSIRLSESVGEIHRAGKRHREGNSSKPK